MKYSAITLSLILPFFVLGQNLIKDDTRIEQLLYKAKEHPDHAFFYLSKAKAEIFAPIEMGL